MTLAEIRGEEPTASGLDAKAGPLYEKVKAFILRQIREAAWLADDRIPSENELVQQFGVSRMTVHRALRELTRSGHLVRVQGVGTFVARRESRSELLRINNIPAEIAARGHRHRAQVLRLKRLRSTPEITRAFEFAIPRAVFHSVIVHYEEDLPVQLEERFVNPALVPDYDRQDFRRITPSDYLLQMTPVSEIEHEIRAIAIDADIAERLDLQAGAPCLLLRRRTWSGSVVATVNRFIYAGSRCTLASRYRPTDHDPVS